MLICRVFPSHLLRGAVSRRDAKGGGPWVWPSRAVPVAVDFRGELEPPLLLSRAEHGP